MHPRNMGCTPGSHTQFQLDTFKTDRERLFLGCDPVSQTHQDPNSSDNYVEKMSSKSIPTIPVMYGLEIPIYPIDK